jgi:hypothetical protein
MKPSRILGFALIAMLLGVAVAYVLGRPGTTSLDVAGWAVYGGQPEGWTVRYPPEWRLQPFTRCDFIGYRSAIVVTNSDFVFDGPHEGRDECYGRFFLDGFPEDRVALAFQPYGFRIGLFNPCEDPKTRLPMHWDDLIWTNAIRGGPAMGFQTVCVGDVPVYMVRTWTGRSATDTDRRALELVLESIRILRKPSHA